MAICKPFVKWVGGKRQLVNELKKLMPKKYNRYIEPFIGGGALFFDLKPKNALIGDYNNELVNLYRIIQKKPIDLIEYVKRHKNESDYYYGLRALDRDNERFELLTDVERASRFLYLNKSGFNGLYRVNQKGQCNVPFGRYKNPKYLDEDNILNCSKLLQNTQLFSGDFENVKSEIKKGDFIYLDPPYAPLTATAGFTAYTDKGFDDEMQLRLREFCDYIDDVDAYFMLSNSYCDFILNLYNVNGYNIHTVDAKRNINCKGDGRGKVKEVVAINY